MASFAEPGKAFAELRGAIPGTPAVTTRRNSFCSDIRFGEPQARISESGGTTAADAVIQPLPCDCRKSETHQFLKVAVSCLHKNRLLGVRSHGFSTFDAVTDSNRCIRCKVCVFLADSQS